VKIVVLSILAPAAAIVLGALAQLGLTTMVPQVQQLTSAMCHSTVTSWWPSCSCCPSLWVGYFHGSPRRASPSAHAPLCPLAGSSLGLPLCSYRCLNCVYDSTLSVLSTSGAQCLHCLGLFLGGWSERRPMCGGPS